MSFCVSTLNKLYIYLSKQYLYTFTNHISSDWHTEVSLAASANRNPRRHFTCIRSPVFTVEGIGAEFKGAATLQIDLSQRPGSSFHSPEDSQVSFRKAAETLVAAPFSRLLRSVKFMSQVTPITVPTMWVEFDGAVAILLSLNSARNVIRVR